MLKIDFGNQILALFDVFFWPFNKSHEKINIIFVISAIIASIWNVFIKFHWHDEKLTLVRVPLCWKGQVKGAHLVFFFELLVCYVKSFYLYLGQFYVLFDIKHFLEVVFLTLNISWKLLVSIQGNMLSVFMKETKNTQLQSYQGVL